jgi:hypothetical protein
MGISIWAVNDGEKVYKNDFNNPNKRLNSAWDGEGVRLFSGRNETVAFQVIFENGNRMQRGIQIALSGFDGFTHAAFKQHYHYIAHDRITPPAWFYGEGARPKKFGWTPDALVPMEAAAGATGAGVDVLPGETQGFWVDLYVPRDTKAGMHEGSVTLRGEGGILATLPVSLDVRDVTLTDDFRRVNMVVVGGLERYYPHMKETIYDEFRKMARAHGFDCVGSPAHRMKFDAEYLDKYYERYMKDGATLFTDESGYHGWGLGRGERIFPVGLYGARIMGETDEELVAEARKWDNWFKSKKWDGTHFWYIIDEPSREEQFNFVKHRAGLLKENGIGLPVFTTTRYREALDAYIDHFSSGHGVNLDDRAAHPDKAFSFYNGYAPRTPMVIMDGNAVEFRANQWLKERYDVDLYFYWESTHWTHNMQGPRRNTAQNVWKDPIHFINARGHYGDNYDPQQRRYTAANGDGTLFYPGCEPFFLEEDLAYSGPVPSIRMKNLRRGAQDAAYVQMAMDKGLAEEAAAIVKKAVPAGMSEAVKEQPSAWSPVGNDWDGYRAQLLALLV